VNLVPCLKREIVPRRKTERKMRYDRRKQADDIGAIIEFSVEVFWDSEGIIFFRFFPKTFSD